MWRRDNAIVRNMFENLSDSPWFFQRRYRIQVWCWGCRSHTTGCTSSAAPRTNARSKGRNSSSIGSMLRATRRAIRWVDGAYLDIGADWDWLWLQQAQCCVFVWEWQSLPAREEPPAPPPPWIDVSSSFAHLCCLGFGPRSRTIRVWIRRTLAQHSAPSSQDTIYNLQRRMPPPWRPVPLRHALPSWKQPFFFCLSIWKKDPQHAIYARLLLFLPGRLPFNETA